MNNLAYNYSDKTTDGNQSFLLNESTIAVADLMQAPMESMKIQAASQLVSFFYEATKINVVLKIDYEKITQSILYVVQNALKASQPETSIYVSTGLDFNGDFYIRVDDEGQGITPEKLEQILEPYTKCEQGIKHINENAGLGLSLVNAYLKMHFGTLRMQSVVNRGTSVTLTIPKSCLVSR
ncbi:MAG: ATP-binding protein [Rhizobiales bacterium]|nr:ATP-binding protein [Hyphomicrobiales bacterium]NRB13560.1 ATP-binding protein [Hyphomicrobiales bacterium]